MEKHKGLWVGVRGLQSAIRIILGKIICWDVENNKKKELKEVLFLLFSKSSPQFTWQTALEAGGANGIAVKY